MITRIFNYRSGHAGARMAPGNRQEDSVMDIQRYKRVSIPALQAMLIGTAFALSSSAAALDICGCAGHPDSLGAFDIQVRLSISFPRNDIQTPWHCLSRTYVEFHVDSRSSSDQ